jgi:hypothetical protein
MTAMRSIVSFFAALSLLSLAACAYEPGTEDTSSSSEDLKLAAPAADKVEPIVDTSTVGREPSGEKLGGFRQVDMRKVETPSFGNEKLGELRHADMRRVEAPALEDKIVNLSTFLPRCDEPRCGEAPASAVRPFDKE